MRLGLLLPDKALGPCMSLIGSFMEPCKGLRMIPWDAVAHRVHGAEMVLRARIPLVGSFAEPPNRLRVILWSA